MIQDITGFVQRCVMGLIAFTRALVKNANSGKMIHKQTIITKRFSVQDNVSLKYCNPGKVSGIILGSRLNLRNDVLYELSLALEELIGLYINLIL